MKTIEEELINALYKAEAITEDAKACLGKVSGDSQLSTVFYYLKLPIIMWWNCDEEYGDSTGNNYLHPHGEITLNKL